jgi:hypothetical protein
MSVRYAVQVGDTLYEGEAFFQGMAARRSGVSIKANPYETREGTMVCIEAGMDELDIEQASNDWEEGHTIQDGLILEGA